MFFNRGKQVADKYGVPEKEVLFTWWTVFREIEKDLKRQKKFEEAAWLSNASKRGLEVGYNFYRIEVRKVSAAAGMLVFYLVFYVAYTLWWGYAVLFLCEGAGVQMKAGAEKEETVGGSGPFGMSFVRANATAISVNVFRIIKNLDELAPKQYLELYSRFQEIQDRIHQELTQQDLPPADRLVYSLGEVDKTMADQVGGKMANLGEIKNRIGLAVPDGFVVSSLAYRRFMAHSELQAEIDRRLQSSRTEEMADLYRLSSR